MKLPRNKVELIALIQRQHRQFVIDVAGVAPGRCRDVVISAGEPRVRVSVELILHDLIAWNSLMPQLARPSPAGACAKASCAETVLLKARLLARTLRSRLAGLELSALKRHLQDAHELTIASLQACSDAELFDDSAPLTRTRGRLVQFSMQDAYDEARTRLRWWRRHG